MANIEQSSDFDLARAASLGDHTAFEELYIRHHRRVYSLCLRMTSNPAEAEDLTQEVFIQLFRRVGSYRGEAAFSTWLHRLTVNQVLMRLRKKDIKLETTTPDGEIPVNSEQNSGSPIIPPFIDAIALERAISQLPTGYRTVFILHDIEGYEHEEIGKLLEITIGTSKSQLHKARMKLRSLLLKKV